MCRLLALTVLSLLCYACGGGAVAPNNSDNSATNTAAGNPRPEPDPAAEPDDKAWLRIEARNVESGFELFLDDQSNPSNLEAIKSALKTYAARKEPSAGLPGPDREGISANPIRFVAAPDVSSLAFWVTLETMVGALLWRIQAELSLSDRQPEKLMLELPRESGLGSKDELVIAPMKVSMAEGRIDYLVRNDDRDYVPIENAGFDLKQLSGTIPATLYSTSRDAIRAGLTKAEKEAGVVFDKIEVSPTTELMPTKDQISPWGASFIAFAAINKIKLERKGKLLTTFKFIAATDAYTRD